MYSPHSGSGNGYDDLVLASDQVQHDVSKEYLDRVWFTPGKKDEAVKQASSSIATVNRGLSKPIEFNFVPAGPFDPSPDDRGWRMLGRTVVWRLDGEAQADNFDAAARDAITATRFGFALTGGDAMDASLGFATADDARKSIAPHLRNMGAGQLNNLADGLQHALDTGPPLKQTFEHEKENMLRSVQLVQDSFLKGEFYDLKQRLGPDVRDSITYLQDLRDKSSTKQAAYFEGFAAEASEEARWLEAVSDLPLEDRQRDPGPQLAKDRQWKTFAKHFFSAGAPLLSMRDATLARTRLTILECRILARVKSGQPAPKDLSGFDKDLTTDPYTGRQLVYKASGTDFTIYSVGEDLKDDGGSTDQSFSSPDLTIERSTD